MLHKTERRLRLRRLITCEALLVCRSEGAADLVLHRTQWCDRCLQDDDAWVRARDAGTTSADYMYFDTCAIFPVPSPTTHYDATLQWSALLWLQQYKKITAAEETAWALVIIHRYRRGRSPWTKATLRLSWPCRCQCQLSALFAQVCDSWPAVKTAWYWDGTTGVLVLTQRN